jgi:hypothetical protein
MSDSNRNGLVLKLNAYFRDCQSDCIILARRRRSFSIQQFKYAQSMMQLGSAKRKIHPARRLPLEVLLTSVAFRRFGSICWFQE